MSMTTIGLPMSITNVDDQYRLTNVEYQCRLPKSITNVDKQCRLPMKSRGFRPHVFDSKDGNALNYRLLVKALLIRLTISSCILLFIISEYLFPNLLKIITVYYSYKYF